MPLASMRSRQINKMAGLAILLILLSVPALLTSRDSTRPCMPPCPPPWLAFRGSCYLWVNASMSWMDAEDYCQALSNPWKMVHLVSIGSQEEDDFVAEYVKQASGLPYPPGYWLGYNDRDRENIFTWTDGSNNTAYNNWLSGEPDNWRNEDCAERFDYANRWNDRDCGHKIRFVCKM